jgi:acyl-CoA dehydrogenase
MGFIEETGAAQHYRDARIITIYEGTTGIQANDLVGRKTARDAGTAAYGVIAEMEKLDADLRRQPGLEFAAIRDQLAAAVAALRKAVDWVVKTHGNDPRAAYAAAVPYLKQWGLTAGGWQMARAGLAASMRLAEGGGDQAFLRAKIATARFYADYYLPQAVALQHAVVTAGDSVLALADEQF